MIRIVLAATIVLTLASAAKAVLPSGLDGLGVTIYRQTMQAGDYDMIAAAGLKVARTDLGWGYVETVKGVYDFSAFDAFYSGFHSRGITPLFILDYGNGLYGTDVTTETFRQGYAAYAAAAAAHFKAMGGGVIWETSPEPDLAQYWSGSATDYMNMVKEAVPAIRQADSSRHDYRSLDVNHLRRRSHFPDHVLPAGLALTSLTQWTYMAIALTA